MTRRLISDLDRLALMSAVDVSAERERIRQKTGAPLTWRLCPSFTAFYDPTGMTQAEIDAYEAAKPKVIRTRDLLRRITDAEHDAIDDLAKSNKRVRRLMHLMLADATTDVNHQEFVQGWQFLKSVGIPAIWPDAATADAAIARIRA